MKNLVLCHGALGSSKEFELLIPHLSQHFKVTTFDFEGHGNRPSNNPFNLDLFSENLLQHIRDNKIEKPQIFGFSMGGYVAYNTAINHGDQIGDIMSLGSKLKWDPLIAKLESSKMNPDKIEEKVPKFAAYLSGLHLNWKQNMNKTVDFMLDLGSGAALSFKDFSQIKNKCFIGLGDMDAMVSCQETLDVDAALPNSFYYKLSDSQHPLPQLDMPKLANKIIEFLI